MCACLRNIKFFTIAATGDIDIEEEKVHLLLSMQQVRDSHSIYEHQLVSRANKALLFKCFGYSPYFTSFGVSCEYAHPTSLAHSKLLDMEDFEKRDNSSKGVNHLRTIDKLQAYALEAKDHTHIKKHGG
jgi:hypothetical protein